MAYYGKDDFYQDEDLEISNVNERIEEIVAFLKDGEGFDRNEFLTDILSKIRGLRDYASDEISLIWGREELMTLDDFVNEFYAKLVDSFCNVINSFKDR